MPVTPERLEEFRRICEEELGEPISTEEAREMHHRLIELYRALLEPLPEELEEGFSSRPPETNPPPLPTDQ